MPLLARDVVKTKGKGMLSLVGCASCAVEGYLRGRAADQLLCRIKRTCQSRAGLWQVACNSPCMEVPCLHIMTTNLVVLETHGETAHSNLRITVGGLEMELGDSLVCVRPWVQVRAPQRKELAVGMELLLERQCWNACLPSFVLQDDRSLINLHLMHTSYFLFVMVITMFCYAVIKGRPSKLRQSNPEFCPEKVSKWVGLAGSANKPFSKKKKKVSTL